MKLEELLAQKKSPILERWFQLLLETYPAETARFLKREENRFANPVGHTLYQGMQGIYEELLNGMASDKINVFLDPIVRVRAVQDFSPARAVAFIFFLKRAIREELAGEMREGQTALGDFLDLESRIDDLALYSFDLYMECRRKIYEIRVNEIKRRTSRLLQRTNLLAESPEPGPEQDGLRT
ncbi:MAG: RsbRD N-terminal domain-containing protein [Firmicutes bacterium]|nr:RsbRD N-terminal domain-containing protein [Bacillota bacterium]MCL5040386.1 RsbRD N-terminal domain-containing protein [Bacillota bacterium]